MLSPAYVAMPRSYRASADDAEFERFFLANFDGLVRSLAAITGDRELASDCVQEAFIRAFARWRRIRRFDNPSTWVRRVAINLSLDSKRSDRRRVNREEGVSLRAADNQSLTAEAVISNMRLVELLSQLTPQQRSVAALFYIEDLPVNQIAESLLISTGAVKFHLNKARGQLRDALEREESRNER